MILEKAKEHLKCNGAMKAIDYLSGQTDTEAIMTGYKELVQYTCTVQFYLRCLSLSGANSSSRL